MGKKPIVEPNDFVGYKKGKIEVIGEGFFDEKSRKRKYEVFCHNCGSVYYQTYSNLKKVEGKGCINCRAKYQQTHGMKRERIYNVWKQMKHRCNNPNDEKHYKNYGGRGIKVCKDWEESFVAFRDWAYKNGWKDDDIYYSGRNKITIDRIDVNGDYCPENCRFVTHQENQWNKRNTRFVFYYGVKYTLKDLAKKLNITIPCLIGRIKYWDMSRWNEPQRRRNNV